MSNKLHKAKKADKPLKGTASARAAKFPSLPDKLSLMVEYFAKNISRRCSSRNLQGGELDRMFILSVSDGKTRAKTMSLSVQGQHESGWIQEIVPEIAKKLKTVQDKFAEPLCWLRLEWVIKQEKTNWADFSRTLRKYKRNYFRSGIALPGTKEPWLLLTEMELNANACLYPGNDAPTTQVNRNNLETYIKARHGSSQMPQFSAALPVIIFQTAGVFLDAQTGQMHVLGTDLRQQGHRKMPGLNADSLQEILDLGSQYLASQIQENGQYRYGYFPCFGQEIPTYNTLRHASSTYALLESYEACRTFLKTGKTSDSFTMPVISNQRVTPKTLADMQRRIVKALHYLITHWIRHYKDELSYLTDVEDDIKLGGNAVTILALVKYISVFPDDDNNAAYLNLANRLANGIIATQQHNGSFVHVLNAKDLSVKKKHRIIYYDGEATFSLMRLYGISHEQKLLDGVVHAFEYFIANHHEKAHDHWLAYCSNELVKYLPEKKYFDFAVRNVRGHVPFIRERITTFPTLLELSMAFHNTLMQLDTFPDFHDVLKGFNVSDFYHALHTRANYLLNGFFFPEMAMFYKYPNAILHGMFIRHHSFRVRIDDVEHYLSGFVAYQKLMLTKQYPKSLTELPIPNKADTASETTFNGPVVFFGGDVNLGRRMHWKAQEANPLADLALMRRADLRIVNLECVIATRGEQGINKGEGGPYYFRARPEQTNILMDAGVDMVATANNHSGDYGPEALLEQLEYLEKAGIAHAGSGATEEDAAKPAYLKAGELTVAVFSVDATTVRYAPSARSGIWYLPPDKPHLWENAFKERLEDARSKAHIVFVAVHWGLNGLREPRQQERVLGHLLIDLGADAVLGCHSHNVQGVEKYRERPILYDAGDFLFDAMSEAKAGGCFLLELSGDGVTRVMFQPLEVGYGRTVPASQPLKISQDFITQCKALETEARLLSSGKAVVDFSPPKRNFSPKIPASPPALRNPIPPLDKPLPRWIVDEVPTDAQMNPILFGPLMLVGCRIPPECLYMTHRRMLYVETYWQIPEATSMNCSFFMTGVPRKECRMPAFGAAMGHEGCDWMWPTNRWKPGVIYKERFGLRPPELRQIVNTDLRLEIRVKAGDTVYGPYIYPQNIQLRFPGIPHPQNN